MLRARRSAALLLHGSAGSMNACAVMAARPSSIGAQRLNGID